jgi:hypothetical protein
MTENDIELLVSKSDPATFGRGPEDVLDETYRKAWKLDEDSFCWRFNPDSGEFVSRLAQKLCPWDSFEKGIRVEPYKLNVYGETILRRFQTISIQLTIRVGQGGFFKTHKDTPRAENMFGSLVFTLPTQYQGGNLNLRHRTREHSFDAAALLQSASPTSVAYVAFYSDVNHEVLEVTSGHRITITFNLYFDEFRAPSILPEKKLNVPMNPFMSALREVVRNVGFLKENKYLGFGLEHCYPMEVLGHPGADSQFRDKWAGYLKGPDALLYRSLKEMGLDPDIGLLYESSNIYDGSEYFWVLLYTMLDGQLEREVEESDSSLSYLMEEDKYACIVWKDGESLKTLKKGEKMSPWSRSYMEHIKEYKSRSINISWVTEPTSNLSGETQYTELGNEAQQEIYYFEVCIVVDLSGRI